MVEQRMASPQPLPDHRRKHLPIGLGTERGPTRQVQKMVDGPPPFLHKLPQIGLIQTLPYSSISQPRPPSPPPAGYSFSLLKPPPRHRTGPPQQYHQTRPAMQILQQQIHRRRIPCLRMPPIPGPPSILLHQHLHQTSIPHGHAGLPYKHPKIHHPPHEPHPPQINPPPTPSPPHTFHPTPVLISINQQILIITIQIIHMSLQVSFKAILVCFNVYSTN